MDGSGGGVDVATLPLVMKRLFPSDSRIELFGCVIFHKKEDNFMGHFALIHYNPRRKKKIARVTFIAILIVNNSFRLLIGNSYTHQLILCKCVHQILQ